MSLVEILASVAIGIGVLGLSAVTLARRTREPCTACRRGELAIERDFSWRCGRCGASFRRRAGKLEHQL